MVGFLAGSVSAAVYSNIILKQLQDKQQETVKPEE